MFTQPGYNNHALNTLLCKLSVAAFGLSEFTLRLPSILCGWLYFAALFRLPRLLFGHSGWLLIAVTVNSLDFGLHPVTFKQAGPLRLSVRINGKHLGEKRCASASDYTFEQPVPRQWIRQDGVKLVETTLDKFYIAPEDQQKLGYLFRRGGLLRSLVHQSSD